MSLKNLSDPVEFACYGQRLFSWLKGGIHSIYGQCSDVNIIDDIIALIVEMTQGTPNFLIVQLKHHHIDYLWTQSNSNNNNNKNKNSDNNHSNLSSVHNFNNSFKNATKWISHGTLMTNLSFGQLTLSVGDLLISALGPSSHGSKLTQLNQMNVQRGIDNYNYNYNNNGDKVLTCNHGIIIISTSKLTDSNMIMIMQCLVEKYQIPAIFMITQTQLTLLFYHYYCKFIKNQNSITLIGDRKSDHEFDKKEIENKDDNSKNTALIITSTILLIEINNDFLSITPVINNKIEFDSVCIQPNRNGTQWGNIGSNNRYFDDMLDDMLLDNTIANYRGNYLILSTIYHLKILIFKCIQSLTTTRKYKSDMTNILLENIFFHFKKIEYFRKMNDVSNTFIKCLINELEESLNDSQQGISKQQVKITVIDWESNHHEKLITGWNERVVNFLSNQPSFVWKWYIVDENSKFDVETIDKCKKQWDISDMFPLLSNNFTV